jgi:hypothetical protein
MQCCVQKNGEAISHPVALSSGFFETIQSNVPYNTACLLTQVNKQSEEKNYCERGIMRFF